MWSNISSLLLQWFFFKLLNDQWFNLAKSKVSLKMLETGQVLLYKLDIWLENFIFDILSTCPYPSVHYVFLVKVISLSSPSSQHLVSRLQTQRSRYFLRLDNFIVFSLWLWVKGGPVWENWSKGSGIIAW